jgi:uncharacterized protein RhaS with RHS repeats
VRVVEVHGVGSGGSGEPQCAAAQSGPASGRITVGASACAANVAQPAFNQTFGYDDLNRLSSWTASSTSQAYQYDLTGNRTRLTIGATGTHLYTYDEGGRLIGEYDNTATPRVRQETVYLGDTPAAVLTQTVCKRPAKSS